ncbi:MAG: 23S rRNA (adenine(2503)-C(2))-methyltransferase RlmN [Clostridia bacterium]|nr:23S rRNA (adenine(2503)-C(2))-methyltransferase RlmN [Clostridia bacterium]
MSGDILSMTLPELQTTLTAAGLPAFRAKQIFQWLHQHGAADYGEMTNLPKSLRETLAASYPIIGCRIVRQQTSALDGTVKFLFAMQGGDYVESVVMQYKYGATICVSSQIGCKMGCAFCASTLGGFRRGLTAGEMLSQLYTAERALGIQISHIVLMGMGEPLDNFDNVMRFLSLVNDENGRNLSMRNISLSTCGLVPQIRALQTRHLQLTLSVSLHAPNNDLRDRIMPVNRRYPIEELLSACRDYAAVTSRRISFEYAMLAGVNDSDACALELAQRLRGMLCHVNLIPVNEVAESPFHPSSPERVQRFVELLARGGVNATVRRKLGGDIDASCGQLRRRQNENHSEGGEAI